MLIYEETLPVAKLKSAARDRNTLGGSGQHHPNMARHVVRPFQGVREIGGMLWYQALQKTFEVSSGARVSILEEDEAGAGMLDQDGGNSGRYAAPDDQLIDLIGDFVGADSVRRN